MAPTSNRRSHSRLSVAARWSGNVRSLSNAAGVTLVQALGDDYARDLGVFDVEGSEYPGCTVYQKDGDRVRVFYNGEMPAEAADPGQYPRGAVDIAPLWNLLDMTPSGRARIGIPSSNTELDRGSECGQGDPTPFCCGLLPSEVLPSRDRKSGFGRRGIRGRPIEQEPRPESMLDGLITGPGCRR